MLPSTMLLLNLILLIDVTFSTPTPVNNSCPLPLRRPVRIWCRAKAKDYRQYCNERGRLCRSNRRQSRLADESVGSEGLLRSTEIFALDRCQDSRSQDLRFQSDDGRELQRR